MSTQIRVTQRNGGAELAFSVNTIEIVGQDETRNGTLAWIGTVSGRTLQLQESYEKVADLVADALDAEAGRL